MTSKAWVGWIGGAEVLDCSPSKFRRLYRTDPRFPKARLFGDNLKFLVTELIAYAESAPVVVPGTRGLRGEKRPEKEAA